MADATLNQIEIDDTGHILIRWRKPNGEWHRTAAAPEGVAAQIAAVEDHLSNRGHNFSGKPCLCNLAAGDNDLIDAFVGAARGNGSRSDQAKLKRITIDAAKGDLHVTMATAEGKLVPTWITPDVDLKARLDIIDGELKAAGAAGMSDSHIAVINRFRAAAVASAPGTEKTAGIKTAGASALRKA